jgi:hypothetical protein
VSLVSAPFPEFVYSDVGYGFSSCSAAEALERHGPFVNPTLASHALALLIPRTLRILAAANRELEQAVGQGLFRRDLYLPECLEPANSRLA